LRLIKTDEKYTRYIKRGKDKEPKFQLISCLEQYDHDRQQIA